MDFGKSTTLRALTSEELDHVSGGDIVVTGQKRRSSDGGSSGGFGGFGGFRSGYTGGGFSSGGHGGGGSVTVPIGKPVPTAVDDMNDNDGDGVPDPIIIVTSESFPDNWSELSWSERLCFLGAQALGHGEMGADLSCNTNISGDNPNDPENRDRQVDVMGKAGQEALKNLGEGVGPIGNRIMRGPM